MCRTAGDAHCGLPREQGDHRALCGVPWGSALAVSAGGRVGFSKEMSGKAPMCMQERLSMGIGNRKKLSLF